MNINWQKLTLELIVVFLGVTSGFILNNYKDSRKDKKLEKKYIESFLQDTNDNIEELSSILSDDSTWVAVMRTRLVALAADTLPPDSIPFMVQGIVQTSNVGVTTNTFEDIKFSGNLNLIRDFALKEQIVNYHKEIEGTVFIDDYYNNYFSDFVMPFLIEEYDMRINQFPTVNEQLKVKLFNTTAGYYSMRIQRTDNLKQLLEESHSLKMALEEYLN